MQGAFYNVAKLVANGGLVAMAGALAEYFGAIEGASLEVQIKEHILVMHGWYFAVIAAIMVLIGLLSYKDVAVNQINRLIPTKTTSKKWGGELVAVIANFFTKSIFLLYLFIILYVSYRLAEGFIMNTVQDSSTFLTSVTSSWRIAGVFKEWNLR